ncbi:MAG: hypothetical protein LBP36_04170 [Oscillospiraceae bacterium]|nr:hypothetical protein [Oscillospiraceae bacterium]
MFRKFFEGWYFKHQNKNDTISIIPGVCHDKAFIQIVTDEGSYNIDFDKNEFSKGENIKIDKNIFSFSGMEIDINKPDFKIKGKINYSNLTPIKYDIMGPFKFLPQCRHGIISMHHSLNSYVDINDRHFDLNGGTGYIEKDSGCSFPERYAWVHSNDFYENCSVTAAIADIPFLGFHFEGLICIIHYKNKEYRIATYNGGKVLKCKKDKIVVGNKNLKLEICTQSRKSHALFSPIQGEMSGIIKESPSCKARFKFYENNNLIFDMESPKASCEFVGY